MDHFIINQYRHLIKKITQLAHIFIGISQRTFKYHIPPIRVIFDNQLCGETTTIFEYIIRIHSHWI